MSVVSLIMRHIKSLVTHIKYISYSMLNTLHDGDTIYEVATFTIIFAFPKDQLEGSAKEEDDDNCGGDGSDLLSELLPFLYKVLGHDAECLFLVPTPKCFIDALSLNQCRLKKYDRPSGLEIPDGPLQDHLSCNADVVVQQAESAFYNCDFGGSLRLTSGVLKEDPYHTECLPVHVSCLVQTNNSNG